MLATGYTKNADGTSGLMGDFWTLTAASAQTGYPIANLLTNSGAPWVSWGQRASHNWLEGQIDARMTTRYIDILGLLGIDRTFPTHQRLGPFLPNFYRMLISEYPIASRYRPQVVTIATTNLTGVAATLNGPIDPPNLIPSGYTSTKLTASNPAINTILVADFANHNATELPFVSGNHTLRVHYVHSNSPTAPPTLSVQMRYNGVLVGSVLTAILWERTSEGFIGTYQFTPPGTTGQVGVRIEGTSTGSSTPEPIGLELITELNGWIWDSLADLRQDSGFHYPQIIEMPERISIIDPIQGLLPVEIAADISDTARYVYIEASDFCEYTTATYGAITARTYIPAGGFEGSAFYASRFVAAESALSLDVQVGDGVNLRKGGDQIAGRTRGGIPRANRISLTWDEADVTIPVVPGSILFAEARDFFSLVGFVRPFLVVFDEANPARQAFWVLFTGWDAPDVGWLKGDDYSEERWDLTFSVAEAQAIKIRT